MGSQMGSSSFDCLFDGGGAGSFSGFIESDKSDSLSRNKLKTSLIACLRPMFLKQRTTIISDLKNLIAKCKTDFSCTTISSLFLLCMENVTEKMHWRGLLFFFTKPQLKKENYLDNRFFLHLRRHRISVVCIPGFFKSNLP